MVQKHAVIAGAAGGVAGGVVFGMLMGMQGMLPMVAKLVGASSSIVGFVVHLGISVVIGIGFGVLAANRFPGFGSLFKAGLGYGIVWWFLGPLTLMPLMMGMGLGVNWNLTAAYNMLPSLMGHVIYGLVLAGVYSKVRSRLELACGQCAGRDSAA